MSAEVPIIILIIAIPIYFLSKFVLKRLKFGNDKSRKYVAIVPAVFFSPIIYTLLIASWIFCVQYYPKGHFNKQEWEINIEERYTMSRNIIKSEMLLGKSKEEVIELLGNEYSCYSDNHMGYYLGFVPRLFNIDPDYLDIYFENGIVVKVSQ
ncbi:hypothetical protein LJC67_07545, partial [Bacteroidales bacterium OttesenSCG-928-A14]|nr:hypothetical protein [Bacteroidales bacterium OttesenSCG-928-A14]